MKYSGRSRVWLAVFRDGKAILKFWEELPGSPVVTTPSFHWRGHSFDPCSGNWDLACCAVWPKNQQQKDSERIQNPGTILMYDYPSTQITPDFVFLFYVLGVVFFFPLFWRVILVNRIITRSLKEHKEKVCIKKTKLAWATLVEEPE